MYKNQIFSGEELKKNLGMDVPSGSRDHFQIAPEDDQFDMAFMAGEGEDEIPGGLYSNYWQDGSNLVGDHLQLVSSETMMMQEGFSLSSPKLKAKRRKAAVAERMEVYGGHVVRSSGGRRDRHSKVCTARGTTRDRRVRLSPKTAIQFYDVQDRLGYDRPSKAIDWLMKEAKAAIDALDESQTPPPPPQPAGNLDTNTPESIFFSNYELHRYEEDSNSILNQGGFLPPSIPPDLFDPNSELLRLQRIFNFPGCSYEREPLQSSITNISQINPQFSSFRLPNEQIPNLAAATMAEAEIDNNMDKILHHIS